MQVGKRQPTTCRTSFSLPAPRALSGSHVCAACAAGARRRLVEQEGCELPKKPPRYQILPRFFDAIRGSAPDQRDVELAERGCPSTMERAACRLASSPVGCLSRSGRRPASPLKAGSPRGPSLRRLTACPGKLEPVRLSPVPVRESRLPRERRIVPKTGADYASTGRGTASVRQSASLAFISG
jgi:hypothetical protein